MNRRRWLTGALATAAAGSIEPFARKSGEISARL